MEKQKIINDLADLGKIVRTTPRKRVKVCVYKDGKFLTKEKSRYQQCEELCRQLATEVKIVKPYVKMWGEKKYISEADIPKYKEMKFHIYEEYEIVKTRPRNPYAR